MKTTKILAIAIIAAGLAACGGKTNSTEAAADSTEVMAADSIAEITSVEQIESAEQVATQLQAAIESGDEAKAQSLVTIVQQKISELKAAGDEAAKTQLKEYATTLETICKEKAEQIKSMGTLGTVITTAVSETGVEEAVTALKELGVNTDAAAQAAVNDAKSKANEAVSKAQSKANDAVNEAKSKANEAVSNAAKKALGL